MDSKCTAPDEMDAACMCTAPEGEQDSKCTAPDDIIDRMSTAPDGGDADCFMIHITSALEDPIRATVVNRRHLNNRFRIEDNHCIKLDDGSDISLFKHIQAFSVLRHERQSIPLGLTAGDNRVLEIYVSATKWRHPDWVPIFTCVVVPKYGVRTILQQSVHYPGGQSSSELAIATA